MKTVGYITTSVLAPKLYGSAIFVMIYVFSKGPFTSLVLTVQHDSFKPIFIVDIALCMIILNDMKF